MSAKKIGLYAYLAVRPSVHARSGAPGLEDLVFAFHAGSHGLDSHLNTCPINLEIRAKCVPMSGW